jgi:hypothetical protein
MTFMFVLIIHGATDSRAPQSLAGTEIGFGFLLFCLGSAGAIQTLSLLG